MENTAFSMIDFYDRFVRVTTQHGLLVEPIHIPISRESIEDASVELLQAADMNPDEVGIVQDDFGGTVILTPAGLEKLYDYINSLQEGKAAIVIQRAWRKYRNSPYVVRLRYLKDYVLVVSEQYQKVLQSKRTVESPGPTPDEVNFMKSLNHPESANVCSEYLYILMYRDSELAKIDPMEKLRSGKNVSNTYIMYHKYSVTVVKWICKVLNTAPVKKDLIAFLRSGDVLCRLVCALYSKVKCHLLDKGHEFTLHKIIFFLELLKSLHIKRSLLFNVGDLLMWPEDDPERISGLLVIRTLLTIEKHARKTGWSGPEIELNSSMLSDIDYSSSKTNLARIESISVDDLSKFGAKLIQSGIKPLTGYNAATNVSSSKSSSHENFAKKDPKKPVLDFASSSISLDLDDYMSPTTAKTQFDLNNAMASSKIDFLPHAEYKTQGAFESTFSLDLDDYATPSVIDLPLDSSRGKKDIEHFSEDLASGDQDVDLGDFIPAVDESPGRIESHVQEAFSGTSKGMKAKETLDIVSNEMGAFLKLEEMYINDMVNFERFLAVIIDDRQMKLKALDANITGAALEGVGQFTWRRKEGESMSAYKFRVEQEVQDIVKLQQAVVRIHSLHGNLVEDLKTEGISLGKSLSEFAARATRVYSIYTVLAITGKLDSIMELGNKENAEYNEFQLLMNTITGARDANRNFDVDLGIDIKDDWLWMTHLPISRLGRYSKLEISSDYSLQIALTKIECLNEFILKTVRSAS